MRHFFTLLLTLASLTALAASRTCEITVRRPLSSSLAKPSRATVNLTGVAAQFGLWSAADMKITAAGEYALQAEDPAGGQPQTTFTNATGHWFAADGSPVPSATSALRRVAVKLVGSDFCVTHRVNTSTIYNKVGDEFRFAELLIHAGDTLRFAFHVTLTDDGDEQVDVGPLPAGISHRQDQTDGLPMMALMNGRRQNWVQVSEGERIELSAVVTDTTAYDSVWTAWKSADGKTSLRNVKSEPYVMTTSATPDLGGQYQLTARCYNRGKRTFKTFTMPVYIDVQSDPGRHLTWEGRLPEFSYNFRDEYPTLVAPTKILGDVSPTDRYGKPVNRENGEWWTVVWGSKLNTACGTDTTKIRKAAKNLVKKYDTDFKYIYDVMGWPPDLRARNGYKSTVYIFGSGLREDNTDINEKGGYQSALWYADAATGIQTNWPLVWASWYPFGCFLDQPGSTFPDWSSQREAMIHEGIHALFADLPGAKQSAWFQEAGNTWLQSAMAVRRSGTYGTPGFLDGCATLAPFMPIECYSGWLQDGSFGGPAAEGVNMYGDKGQICTWRSYLGGNQYGNTFPIVLSQMCGDGSIPWIWRHCTTRVLEGIGDFIGDESMRQLIVQYRARLAIFDIGGWAQGYRQVMDEHFGSLLGPEWEPYYIDCAKWKATPYQRLRLNDNDGWLAPDELTNPGWSGANVIPIHVDPEADTVRVEFRPEDTEERAILCYKTKSGKAYYSQMVRCGEMALDVTDRPANGVIMCVVVNTDYRYTGEAQRKHHWDYRLRLCGGAQGLAGQHKKWYMNEQTITDDAWDDLTPVAEVEAPQLSIMNGRLRGGQELRVALGNIDPSEVSVRIVGLQGIVEGEGRLTPSGTYRLPRGLRHGLYVITLTGGGQTATVKTIIE